MSKIHKKIEWRKLDNSAKIFPISAGKRYSTVFRLSAILKEDINKGKLEKAVKIVLDKFESFRVRMKSGMFWNYFEYNPKPPIVRAERDYPCKYIDPKSNNNYLFKVTYFKNKINIDIYHALADGNGGTIFFKEILYTYIELMHPEEFENIGRTTRKVETLTTEDSYMKNYDKNAKSNSSTQKAYVLKGEKISLGAISVIHEIINLEQLKAIAKSKNVTITQYLLAVLIYCIYTANDKETKSAKPIKVCVPVDLRKYYNSKTMSNFFSYLTVEAYIKRDCLQSFDKLLEFVKEDFEKRLNVEELTKTMSINVKLGNNPFIKIVPLFIKKFLVRLSYIEIRKYTTTTLSNIGRMGIIGNYKKFIDYFVLLLAPEPVEKIKCSACSFENDMVFTFTSILANNKVEKAFYEFLINHKIDVRIESNGVLDDISKKD